MRSFCDLRGLVDDLGALRESIDSVQDAILHLAENAKGATVLMTRPEPVAYNNIEGGNWIPWSNIQTSTSVIHAIRFSDGSVLDVVNGWRKNT